MSVSISPTQGSERTSKVLAAVFVLASVVVPILLWSGATADSNVSLRVYLIGWATCGLLLAATVAVPKVRTDSTLAAPILWLGLGLLLGLAIGTTPWSDLAGPVWQLWLTIFLVAGYVHQLRIRSADGSR